MLQRYFRILICIVAAPTLYSVAAWASSPWMDQVNAVKNESRVLASGALDRYSPGGSRGELCLRIGVLQEKARSLVESAETRWVSSAKGIELEILKMRGFCGAALPVYEKMVSLYDYNTLIVRAKALQGELDELQ